MTATSYALATRPAVALARTGHATRSSRPRTEKKTRREATPEQKERAAQRRAAIRGMLAKIKALPIEKRVLLADTLGIRSAEEGRTFSPTNCILLAFQCPTVSIVGGFDQWRKVGRKVRKGARALSLWVPIGTGYNRDGEAEGEATGDTRFVLASVFDIADTIDASLADIDAAPLALPAPAAPIIDDARLIAYGADPAAIAAANNPEHPADEPATTTAADDAQPVELELVPDTAETIAATAAAAVRSAQRATIADRAAAPVTGRDITGQGTLWASDADLFSGPAAEDTAPAATPEPAPAPATRPDYFQPCAPFAGEERAISATYGDKHERGPRGYSIRATYTGERGTVVNSYVTASKVRDLPRAIERDRRDIAAGCVTFTDSGFICKSYTIG